MLPRRVGAWQDRRVPPGRAPDGTDKATLDAVKAIWGRIGIADLTGPALATLLDRITARVTLIRGEVAG